MDEQFKQILIQVRAMQLFYHSSHLLVGRMCFEGDHELFSGFYNAMDDLYDSVAEKALGVLDNDAVLVLPDIVAGIAEKVKELPGPGASENSQYFMASLPLEAALCQLCTEAYDATDDIGLQNFFAGICDESQNRVYKIKRRLLK